jgi:hypothetical protein
MTSIVPTMSLAIQAIAQDLRDDLENLEDGTIETIATMLRVQIAAHGRRLNGIK